MIELASLAETALWGAFAVFLRVGAMLALMPGFGERTVPARIRLGLAMAFTAIVAPAVLSGLDLPEPSVPTLVHLTLTEAAAGLALGAALRLFILALQTAGSIAAQATSLSQLLGGAAGEPLPTIGHILTVAALALLMLTGFHVKAAVLVILSYELLPLGVFPAGAAMAAWGSGHVAQAFALAFTLAAPFVLMSALYNLTLGVINKAMPQLMVAFVGAPLITFGAIAMMFLVAPALLSAWLAAFDAMLSDPFGGALMSAEEDSDKSQEPTERKLQKAREKGEVARSPDLLTAMSYAGVLLAGATVGPGIVEGFGSAMIGFLDHPDRMARLFFADGASAPTAALVGAAIAPALPLFLVPMGLVLLTLLATRTLLFTGSKLSPKASRISPISNAKNKYGRRGIFEFLKSFSKLAIYGACLGLFLAGDIDRIAGSLATHPAAVAHMLGQLLLRFMALAVVVAAAIGAIDYVWQSAEHMRRNRMSMKELRDEVKDSEGDPHIKQQRRARGQEIAMRQMAQEVPNADVLVVNPTHYAVALKWSRLPGTAPECIAKGQDRIALRMREIAEAHGVPIYSDPPTARALHACIAVGEEVGSDHYRAVAAAIRFADRMRAKARKGWR